MQNMNSKEAVLQSKYLSLLKGIVLILISMFYAGISTAGPTEQIKQYKTEIALFKYTGASSNASQKFGVFRGLVNQKIRNLRKQVMQANKPEDEFSYLKGLHINYYDFDKFGPDSEVELWLVNEGVLSAMRGSINSDDGTNYSVYSQFYFEDQTLKPSVVEIVSVRLPVKGSEFANTVDTHTLLMLYMLALDAKSLDPASFQATSLLSEANRLIANIEDRSGTLEGDMLRLKTSIKKLEDAILGPQ